MRSLGAVICALMIAVTSATLFAEESTAAGNPVYTKAQIKKLIREAHTVEQYTILADYYAGQQRHYTAEAVEMMHLWRQRNEVYFRIEKWPRPVDSARNLHDYYEYKAKQAAGLQAKYSKLADDAAAK